MDTKIINFIIGLVLAFAYVESMSKNPSFILSMKNLLVHYQNMMKDLNAKANGSLYPLRMLTPPDYDRPGKHRAEVCEKLLASHHFLDKTINYRLIEFRRYYVCKEDHFFDDRKHDRTYKYEKVALKEKPGQWSDYLFTCLVCSNNTDDAVELFVGPDYDGFHRRFIFTRAGDSTFEPIAMFIPSSKSFIDDVQMIEKEFISWRIDTRTSLSLNFNLESDEADDTICKVVKPVKCGICASVLHIVEAQRLSTHGQGKYYVDYAKCTRKTVSIKGHHENLNLLHSREVYLMECALTSDQMPKISYYVSQVNATETRGNVYRALNDELVICEQVIFPAFPIVK